MDRPVQPPPGILCWETPTAVMWLGDDGMFRICGRPGSVHGADEAGENVEAIPTEVRDRPLPLLADVRHVKSVSRKAREIYRDKRYNHALAVAILVGSPLSRMIGNIFLGLSRLDAPTRLFTSEGDALRWLRRFLPEPPADAR